MFNLLEITSGEKVDFWVLTDTAFDQSRFARRQQIDIGDQIIDVSTPEDAANLLTVDEVAPNTWPGQERYSSLFYDTLRQIHAAWMLTARDDLKAPAPARLHSNGTVTSAGICKTVATYGRRWTNVLQDWPNHLPRFSTAASVLMSWSSIMISSANCYGLAGTD